MSEIYTSVDCGSTAVRAVRVKRGKKPTILRAGQIALPPGVVSDGKILDPDMLSQALRILWREYKIGSKKVIVALSGQNTIVRSVELPWEPPALFRASLPLRVGKDLPMDPSEVVLDFHPQEEYEQRGTLKQRSLVVGATRPDIENLYHAFEDAGLHIAQADYAPFALIRLAASLDPSPIIPPVDGEEYYCDVIVELGEYSSNVIIHKQGYPLYIRPLDVGSNVVTMALADQLGVKFKAAELVKRTLGMGHIELTEEDYEVGEELPEDAADYGQEVINQMGGQLVQSVRETVDFFLGASPNVAGFRSVQLTGRGSLLGGYKDRLQGELKAPANYLNPLEVYGQKSIFRNSEIADPAFGLAFGLLVSSTPTIAAPKTKKPKLEKTPKEPKPPKEKRGKRAGKGKLGEQPETVVPEVTPPTFQTPVQPPTFQTPVNPQRPPTPPVAPTRPSNITQGDPRG